MSATPQRRAYRPNIQQVDQKIGIKECLKLLNSGGVTTIPWEDFKEELLLKPQLGDHIQYELQKYCQRDFNKIDTDIVIKLAELCYSPDSVLCFTDIKRFLGCVYYISSYLLKKEKFQPALNAINSLLLKEREIVSYSKEKSDVRTYLYNLHTSFIGAAIVLASKVQSELDLIYIDSHRLAIESLKFFTYTNTKHSELGKKVLRNSTLYLQSLQIYNQKYVLEFYKKLIDACKILLPKPGSHDYCRYYIHKIIYLDKFDLEKVYLVLQKTVSLLRIILGCPVERENVLCKILDFFWKDCSENCWISDEDFDTLKGCSKNTSELYFLLVSNIFTYGVQFLWKKCEQKWHEKFSAFGIKKILEWILGYHESHIKHVSEYCAKGEGPFDTCFAYLNSRNLQKIQYTVRLFLKSKVPESLTLIPIARRAYRLSMECFESMKSRKCCREHANFLWKSAVIHHTNTVEDVFRHTPSDDTWRHLRDCCREILREVVRSDLELPFDFNRVKILFQRWHTANLKLGNHREALYVCMVLIVSYPNEEKDFMSMWIQAKTEASDDLIEEAITSEIFKTHDALFKEFFKDFSGSDSLLKSVLILELKAYSMYCTGETFKHPSTPYSLTTRIWKQLEKCDLDVWEMSLALSSLILFCASGDMETVPQYLDEKCKKVIQALMDTKEQGKTQCRSLLHTANLLFSLFLFNVKRTEKTEGKMDTTNVILDYLKKAEVDKVKFGEDVDLNLTCDVIPSSSQLTVKLETNYVNEMNKIVDLWTTALGKGFEESVTAFEFDLWLQNVRLVAYLYELFGEYRRAFSTWMMIYKIGKLSENPEATLSGVTHLIQYCVDVDESEMKQEADLIQEKLDSDKHVVAKYFLALASNYLRNNNSEKCLQYLGKTQEILESLRTTIKSYTLNAKFWCLVSQFLAVYKEYKTEFNFSPDIDLRVVVFKAFSYINGGGKSDLLKSASQLECMEHVLAMLEVSLWSYDLHGLYLQSDFMRFFLDDLYQVVQKLFLPTRTAEILALLAEVDLICEKLSECHEKVAKLKSILTNGTISIKLEKLTSPYLSVPQESESKFFSGPLISPNRLLKEKPEAEEFDVSPIHGYLGNAKSAAITQHKKNCKCRLCQNILIQVLTMNAFWLEAEISSLGKNSKHGVECYSQALDVLNNLDLVRSEQNETLRLQLAVVSRNVPGELDFKRNFVGYHCAKLLIKYVQFELSYSKTVSVNVTTVLKRISKIMKQLTYEGRLLEWVLLELKLACIHTERDRKPAKKSTPVLFKPTHVTKTPAIAARKSSEKVKNPPSSVEGKAYVGNNDTSCGKGDDDKLKTYKKVIQPKKLNFSSHKTESNVKTVISSGIVPKEKFIKSRKLNFDSPEEREEQPVTVTKRDEKRETKKCSSLSVSSKKGTLQTVKIYKDSKDEMKPKAGADAKAQRKLRKK